MTDFHITRNLGSIFDTASKTINRNIDPKSITLPPSVTSFINANYYHIESTFSNEEVVKALNSGNDSECYAVLKFLASKLVTKPQSENEVVQLFPHVIKNVNSKNLKIKRLVYILLLQFNHLKPDISLLSINAIQKSLNDGNCIVRSLAIRCLSGIKIPAILPILLLSLEKSVKDSSPLVRSAAAVAIVKCVTLDVDNNRGKLTRRDYILHSLADSASTISQLYKQLDILLSDNDSKVLSISIQAFNACFPGCFDIWHNKVEHVINKLDTLDTFAISITIDILTDYSKCYFPLFNSILKAPKNLQLLWEKLTNFVYSPDANVILSTVRCVSSLFPFAADEIRLTRLLIKFIDNDAAAISDQSKISLIFLNEIELLLAQNDPLIKFNEAQISNFYPNYYDNNAICRSKVNILFQLLNNENFGKIFVEIKHLIDHSDFKIQMKCFILQKLNMLILAQNLDSSQLSLLIRYFILKLQTETNEELISEYIAGLRQLIQIDLIAYVDILIKLTGRLFDTGASPMSHGAKASIIWLIGEFTITLPQIPNEKITPNSKILLSYIPDFCRLITQKFKLEEPTVKLQSLLCLAKVLIIDIFTFEYGKSEYANYLNTNKLFKLWNFILAMAKVDPILDIRDMARTLSSMLPSVNYQQGQWNIEELMNSNEMIQLCKEKCEAIDLPILIFQTDKSIKSLNLTSTDILPCVSKFNNVSSNVLDLEFEDYYNEIRNTGFELKNYDKYNKGISSKSLSSPVVKNSGGFGEIPKIGTMKAKTNKYKLQTLDDFLDT